MGAARSWWLWGVFVFIFLPSLLLAQTGSAPSVFHVVESRMRFPLDPVTHLQLPIESHAERPIAAKIYLQVLIANDRLLQETTAQATIEPGTHTLDIPWPGVFSKETLPAVYWYRLHYRIVAVGNEMPVEEGIVQLSRIIPTVLRLQVSGYKHPQRGSTLPLRVHVGDPRTGKGQGGVQVEAQWQLEKADKQLPPAQGRTNSRGNLILMMKVPVDIEPEPTIDVRARQGDWGEEQLVDLDLQERYNISLSTDKPIYQPGQVLHLRALVLGDGNHARSGETVTFIARGPDDDDVFKKEAKTSDFGVAQIDWEIPQRIKAGEYALMAEIGGNNQAIAQVRISRYELPQFSVEASPDKPYYMPGEAAQVEINASYLFGQPVKRGKVRIVRSGRERWDPEKKEYEADDQVLQQGDLDSSGKFTAAIDLKNDFEHLDDRDYLRYEDVRFAAYVTDLSTNRTEQRHFTLRATKERIHLYVLNRYEEASGPLDLFITAAFPDGTPASVDVKISAVQPEPLDGLPQKGASRQEIGHVHTNKYGVAHFRSSAPVFSPGQSQSPGVDLFLEATDRHGNRGVHSERIWQGEKEYLHITALKSLLRQGESVDADLESSEAEQEIYVDALGGGKLLGTQRIQLHQGHGHVEFPWQEEFRNSLLLVAYKLDFTNERSRAATAEVLFPELQDLDPGVRLQQATYKPGEPALAKFHVRSPEGKEVRSALGIVIYDKAVAERVRTDQEFGRYGFYYSDVRRDGYNHIAGIGYRDLLNRQLTGPVSPDLELLAQAVLAGGWHGQDFELSLESESAYDQSPSQVFQSEISRRLERFENLLNSNYSSSFAYPKDLAELRRMLSASGINFDELRDPWGVPYRASFSTRGTHDVMELISNGPDKLPNTADDFTALAIERPYFGFIGYKIDEAAREYANEGKYVRDFETLARLMQKKGIDLKSLKDPWGHAYAFDFDVSGSNYGIRVRSAGPNGVFAQPGAGASDDVYEWNSLTRYFVHESALLDAALAEHFRQTGIFPTSEGELEPVLKAAGFTEQSLLDPWKHPYHFRFGELSRYSDKISISFYSTPGSEQQRDTNVTPVTQKLGAIDVVSYGPHNNPNGAFPVATFYRVLTEQDSRNPLPEKTSITHIPTAGISGALSGTVTDQQGAVVSGAVIVATEEYSGQKYNATSDSAGHYELSNLPAGKYKVTISSQGFKVSVITAVPVTSSNMTRVDAALSVGTVSETVEVSSAAPQVETTSSRVTASKHGLDIHVQEERQVFTPRVRKYFPETLVWNPELVTDSSGHAELKFQMADNITTWKMSVIASTVDGQTGIAEKELRTFQPFFVDHEPPKVLTQGDQIQLPVILRNYLPKPQEVNVTLEPSSWFSLLSASRQQVKVAPGEDALAQFSISADRSIHEGKERVTAANRSTGDAVERTITVHPDGEEVPQTAAAILVSDRSNLDVDIPANAIPGSIDAELRIYPNLGANVLGSLDGMAARPAGCAEQITSIAFGSVLVLQILHKAGLDDPDKPGNPQAVLARRARKYISEAYQMLAAMQKDDGGFPYWATNAADLAVTAHVLDFMAQAGEFIAVDDSVVQHAAEYLVNQQRPEGGWLHYWYQSRPELDPNLSAFITRVFAETMQRGKHKTLQPAYDKAMRFLEARISEWKDPYLVGQYALAASFNGRIAQLARATNLLHQLAHEEGPVTYWNLEANTSPFYSWGIAGRMETTALAVRALARMQRAEEDAQDAKLIDRGLLYLLGHKDRYGVWYSTQASINVLRAIVEVMPSFAQHSYAGGPADIMVNGKLAGTVQLPGAHDISMPLRMDISSLLRAGSNRIDVLRQGDSSPLQAEVVSTHYIRWADSQATKNSNFKPGESRALRLNVTFDTTSPQPGKPVQCKVEVERIGFAGYGMMMAEIGLPPGAEVDRQSLQHALETSAVNDFDVQPDRVVLYVWPQAGGTKFSFGFTPRFGMNAAATPSILYDYYNPDARAVVAPARFEVH